MRTLVIEEPTAPAAPAMDRWSPIPPNGQRCQFTGMKHGKLYDLLGAGGLASKHVRIVNLRTPGANRGQTLFHVGDMLTFLDSLSRKQVGPVQPLTEAGA